DGLGIVLDASPSTAAILGYPADELVGLRLDSLADPVSTEEIAEVIRVSGQSPAPRAWRLRHRGGHWVSVEATPATRADGAEGHVALAIHDVTRWTALEEQLTRQAF